MVNKDTYKRLTKRDENGRACMCVKTKSKGCTAIAEAQTKILDRLAELEDKIERGELVENKVVTYINMARSGNKTLVDKALKYDELKTKIDNGMLIELPCKIGDTIYLVPSETQFRLNNIGKSFKKHNRVYEMEVYQIYMNKNNYVLYNFEQTVSALGSSFGTTWFLTKAEAEARLKELQEKKE